MKTKIIIICLIASIAVLTSCAPKKNVQKPDIDSYIATFLPYYPYSIEEDFFFVNEELDRKWEAKAYSRDSIYPDIISYFEDNELCESYGAWAAEIYAHLLEKGVSEKAHGLNVISTSIISMGGATLLTWSVQLYFSDKESYLGDVMIECSPDDIYSYFTDTIIIPLYAPEGAYARIVKNQGLTDFSVDGKTVWKRVK